MARRVERAGPTVRRPMEFWAPAVHRLLRHLQEVGFPAPRILGTEDGVEVLTWIEGESGSRGWAKVVPEDGLRRWARFLRRYHDTVAEYRPLPGSVWASGTPGCTPGDIVCDGDFGPWNGVWQGGEVVGLIDWDNARPAPAAYALEYTAPFRDDDECLRWLHYPRPPDRRRRVEVFCDAYGISVPVDVRVRVAEQQTLVLETCQRLARLGVEPQATWVRQGYLDVLRARIRWAESARF